MKPLFVHIPISNIEDALHIQNIAVLNISKYQDNPVEGQEACQSHFVHIWLDVHNQAGAALTELAREINT